MRSPNDPETTCPVSLHPGLRVPGGNSSISKTVLDIEPITVFELEMVPQSADVRYAIQIAKLSDRLEEVDRFDGGV